jgi:hypothetical protein
MPVCLCHKSKKTGDGSTVGVDGLSGVGFHPLAGSSSYGACPTVSSIPEDERVTVLLIIPTILEELHVNVQLEHLLPLLRVGIESTPRSIFQKVKLRFCVAN